MAIVFLQKEKRQRNLIVVLAAVVLIMILVLWLGVFSGGGETEVVEIPLFPKREINIDFGILKNPTLQSFQPFAGIEPFEESTTTQKIIGRENPFLPY